MIELLGITWASPSYASLFIIATVAAIMLAYRIHRISRAVSEIAGAWRTLLIKNYSHTKSIARAVVMSLGIIFLIFALMRPQWSKREEVTAQEGRDVLIALDVSRSMLATDCAPHRLTCAKKKIKQILNVLSSERVGLILFSGAAFVQCPLTTDFSAFSMFLDHVDAETISSGTTALEGALDRALKVFEEMPNKKNKILLIFTDGEDFSTDLAHCRKRAQESNLHIFAIGVGTPQGAPIPLYNERGQQVGHQKDPQGKIVISRLNEDVLQSLAHDAGGMYITMTADDSDIKTLVSRISRYEREWFEDKKLSHYDDKYHYFLLLSLLCLGGEWLL